MITSETIVQSGKNMPVIDTILDIMQSKKNEIITVGIMIGMGSLPF